MGENEKYEIGNREQESRNKEDIRDKDQGVEWVTLIS
jgi:hypothetical protein